MGCKPWLKVGRCSWEHAAVWLPDTSRRDNALSARRTQI